MAIIVNLDVMMAKRKMSLNELSDKVGLTLANLSILKTGKAKAIRFSTLETICKVLDCQPGDILEYRQEWCKNEGHVSQFSIMNNELNWKDECPSSDWYMTKKDV